MLGRDLHENPGVGSHVEQRASDRRTGELLQWLQVMLEGQHASFPLLNV
jgi:hypothetical protein